MGSPFIDDLVTAPWKLDAEGMLTIPKAAWIGSGTQYGRGGEALPASASARRERVADMATAHGTRDRSRSAAPVGDAGCHSDRQWAS